MLKYQGMVVLAGSQVWWTWEVEDVFEKVRKGDKMGMKNYAKKMHKQIDDLVVKVGVDIFLQRKKINLITDLEIDSRASLTGYNLWCSSAGD